MMTKIAYPALALLALLVVPANASQEQTGEEKPAAAENEAAAAEAEDAVQEEAAAQGEEAAAQGEDASPGQRNRARRGARPDRRRGFRRGQPDGPGRAQGFFNRMDVNNDGNLSTDEVPEALRSRLDTDGDGVVTREEFAAAAQQREGRGDAQGQRRGPRGFGRGAWGRRAGPGPRGFGPGPRRFGMGRGRFGRGGPGFGRMQGPGRRGPDRPQFGGARGPGAEAGPGQGQHLRGRIDQLQREVEQLKRTVEQLRQAPDRRPGAGNRRFGPPPGRGGFGARGAFRGQGGVPGGAIADRIMRYDEDGDGKITREELPERMQVLLDRMDRNEDGQLDREELGSGGGRFRGGRGPGGPRRRPAPEAPNAAAPGSESAA